MASSDPFLELAGSPGSGTSQFATGNFGSRPDQHPAGIPKIPSVPAAKHGSARLAAAIARSGHSMTRTVFLP